MMKKNVKNAGFTLLEMAIVLLIIALIAASVVTGRAMLKQASNRAVIAEIDKNIKAVGQFVDKFKALPGDFDEAASFWGADSTCPATSFNETPKQATCNGNGDGMIGSFDGSTYSNSYEWYRAWQHLANAGLIDGQFSGVGGNVAPSQLLGKSIPASRYPNAAYTLYYTYAATANAESWVRSGGQVFELGRIDPSCNSGGQPVNCISHSPVMLPADALEFDAKVDDGRPGTGRVTSRPNNSSVLGASCTDTPSTMAPEGAKYRTDITTNACSIRISSGF